MGSKEKEGQPKAPGTTAEMMAYLDRTEAERVTLQSQADRRLEGFLENTGLLGAFSKGEGMQVLKKVEYPYFRSFLDRLNGIMRTVSKKAGRGEYGGSLAVMGDVRTPARDGQPEKRHLTVDLC